MPQIKSQIKRAKTNEKARIRNHAVKSQLRTAIKKVKIAIDAKDLEKATLLLNKANSLIDKSVSKGVQHRRTADRQKSSITNLVNALK